MAHIVVTIKTAAANSQRIFMESLQAIHHLVVNRDLWMCKKTDQDLHEYNPVFFCRKSDSHFKFPEFRKI